MRVEWLWVLLAVTLAFSAAADDALSADFLEFLGTGTQVGEQWIDPLTLHDSPEVFADDPPPDAAERKTSAAVREDGTVDNAGPETDRDDGGKKHD